ncbi:MAG: PEP-CTERM sorting domain-containing protein [Phycisphaerae bacterium]|jgi:hypothetical protein|nr:PEP-CTERM sorting domain-containing protein [Phycisphaerae bacterium]MCZ2400351.1 PEP-CTERM sorting domain-containing protein [Phycisphaerae bacterium]NUQ49656.1 PEP-CTERM sorting domain-containing protein [Phycisphaerae bacterium]
MLRLLVAACLPMLTLPAYAGLIDLNSLPHGTVVTDQFVPSDGVTVSAVNYNRDFHIAGIFDTRQTGTSAPGLEGPPWAGGNLAPDTIVGNALIIAQNDLMDQNGLLTDPDDEGSQPAGELILDFESPATLIGFDVVDIDTPTQFYAIAFYLGGQFQKRISFPEFINPNSPFYDASVSFGDNHANRIQPITAAQLQISGFDRVVFEMGGSGAIGNLVPEPASLLLLALGGAALIGRRISRG